jgi:hypothetical protein
MKYNIQLLNSSHRIGSCDRFVVTKKSGTVNIVDACLGRETAHPKGFYLHGTQKIADTHPCRRARFESVIPAS